MHRLRAAPASEPEKLSRATAALRLSDSLAAASLAAVESLCQDQLRPTRRASRAGPPKLLGPRSVPPVGGDVWASTARSCPHCTSGAANASAALQTKRPSQQGLQRLTLGLLRPPGLNSVKLRAGLQGLSMQRGMGAGLRSLGNLSQLTRSLGTCKRLGSVVNRAIEPPELASAHAEPPGLRGPRSKVAVCAACAEPR